MELQTDVEALRRELEEQNERARRAERDQAALVVELTAQNTRLADQLREAAKQEEQLLVEVKVLREKCALRNTTLQDHVSSLEILRDEVNLSFLILYILIFDVIDDLFLQIFPSGNEKAVIINYYHSKVKDSSQVRIELVKSFPASFPRKENW